MGSVGLHLVLLILDSSRKGNFTIEIVAIRALEPAQPSCRFQTAAKCFSSIPQCEASFVLTVGLIAVVDSGFARFVVDPDGLGYKSRETVSSSFVLRECLCNFASMSAKPF